MEANSRGYNPLIKQIGHFIIHLRWHYQVLILSGGYLLGGYLSEAIYWPVFLFQFAIVHLLLFGGASAFNSYWDKDTGPIGGLKRPPSMHRWMRDASIIVQFVGLVMAMEVGWLFALFYALSMLLFWLYSTPHFRWKARPTLSLVAIGVSTGANSVFLGYLAAGGGLARTSVWMAAIGCSFIILSLYPVSQLYQTEEDRSRGDETFALKYGIDGVIFFFRTLFCLGLVLIGLAIGWQQWQVGVGFVAVGMIGGGWINWNLLKAKDQKISYGLVMRLKYGCSMAFIGFILILMVNH